MKHKTSVIILYRVIQDWRAPIFEKLSADTNLLIEIWHGPDFKNTKVVSTKKKFNIKTKKLLSLKFSIKSSNGNAYIPFSPFLFFYLIYKRPDVVISEGASNIFNAIQGFIYCKLFGKKFIWWSLGKLLNRSYDSNRKKIDKIIQFIEINSNSIITYSSRGKEYFESIGIPTNRIHIAVNVVDTEEILNKKLNKLDKWEKRNQYHNKYDFVVLFVGALTYEKSIDILIKAQKIIEDTENNNIGLVIVGDGSYKSKLQQIAQEIGVKKIEFVGNKTEDSYKYFIAGDLFVLPGLGGLAISEAMCYSLPIITSVGDGCEVDLVTDSNGIVDISLDDLKLANYILEFYNNNTKLIRFGEESNRIIKNGLNVNNYLKQIKNAIQQ